MTRAGLAFPLPPAVWRLAAAALVVAGKANDLKEGVALAAKSIAQAWGIPVVPVR